MSKNEKQKLLSAIDGISEFIQQGNNDFIKEEYKRIFILGQLDALLMIRETIEHEEYK